MAAAGFRVELSPLVVDTHVPAYTLWEFFQHQLRWARSTRHSRGWGYFGLMFTFGVPWALGALAASGGALWGWALVAGVLALRFAVAVAVAGRVLRDPQLGRDFWLLPFRDLAALAVWLLSYAGHTVAWRGEQFVLRDGKIQPVA